MTEWVNKIKWEFSETFNAQHDGHAIFRITEWFEWSQAENANNCNVEEYKEAKEKVK